MRTPLAAVLEKTYGPLPKPQRAWHMVYPMTPGYGVERFLFTFLTENINEVRRVLGRWASDPDIDFDWTDAARVGQTLTAIENEARAQ